MLLLIVKSSLQCATEIINLIDWLIDWYLFTYLLTYTYTRSHTNSDIGVKVKVKVVDLYSTSTRSISKVPRYSTRCQVISQFYLHTLRFIRKWNGLYLPLPSQPQLVLIYRPWRDGNCIDLSVEYPGRDLNPQPPDYKSGSLPHSHRVCEYVCVCWVCLSLCMFVVEC